MNKKELAWAFVTGKSGTCHNAHTDGQTYTLHKSPIVRKLPSGQYAFYWHGFYTRTTASHMNEVLKMMGSHTRVSYAQARDACADVFVI